MVIITDFLLLYQKFSDYRDFFQYQHNPQRNQIRKRYAGNSPPVAFGTEAKPGSFVIHDNPMHQINPEAAGRNQGQFVDQPAWKIFFPVNLTDPYKNGH